MYLQKPHRIVSAIIDFETLTTALRDSTPLCQGDGDWLPEDATIVGVRLPLVIGSSLSDHLVVYIASETYPPCSEGSIPLHIGRLRLVCGKTNQWRRPSWNWRKTEFVLPQPHHTVVVWLTSEANPTEPMGMIARHDGEKWCLPPLESDHVVTYWTEIVGPEHHKDT